MIYQLQKKFIRICMISFLIVFGVIFSTIYIFNYWQATASTDSLTDIIEKDGGQIRPFDHRQPMPQKPSPVPDAISPEAPFTTRFFTVTYDSAKHYISSNTASIASVSDAETREYGQKALESRKTRGWIGEYRYKVTSQADEIFIIFIQNSNFRVTARIILVAAATVLLGGGTILLILVFVLSKRAVKPVAESYEKQKRFITDANHELKTPLTLMLTDLDIVESEIGKNEWIDDIKSEGNKMTLLINRLVYLARMDEENTPVEKSKINLSDIANETASLFCPLAEQKHLSFTSEINSDVMIMGNKTEISQLLSILMDNAIKYCDADGYIRIALQSGKHPVFYIENSYAAVSSLEMDSLFDRFYRADKARTSGNGFGIGLSIAKAIADNHNTNITVQNMEGEAIRFTIKFRAS